MWVRGKPLGEVNPHYPPPSPTPTRALLTTPPLFIFHLNPLLFAEQVKKPKGGKLALRLSGHLLVGLSRVYSKKVQYLLADSSETLHNLTTSNKPSRVTLQDDQGEEDIAALNRVESKAP